MDEEELKKVWERFAEKQDFMLNPDKTHVERIAKGVLLNESKFGLKMCPCRIRDGTREQDLKLICPCNFKADETWAKKGQCWCGLFVKKQ